MRKVGWAFCFLLVAQFVARPAEPVSPRRPGTGGSGVAGLPQSPADATLPDQPVLRLRPDSAATAVVEANRLFARLLDTAGLYTLIGDLKPMTDVAPTAERTAFNVQDRPRLQREYDAALGAIESDLIQVRVLWGTPNRGQAPALFVFRTDLVRDKIAAHAPAFMQEDITRDTPIRELMARLETRGFRNVSRAQGLLYGFPPYAVEFFCSAYSTGKPMGIGKDRKGLTIPTYSLRSDFTYVIPIENEPNSEDLRIQRRAAGTLAEYRLRRSRYEQGNGQIDALRLINDWYRDMAAGRTPLHLGGAQPEVPRRREVAGDGQVGGGARPEPGASAVATAGKEGATALAKYRALAEQGDANAQLHLGSIYSRGKGVPVDPAEAARYFRLAAESGLARAQVFLALAYLEGRGLAPDTAQAFHWFRQAAERRDAGAYYYLGNMYAQGTGVPRDATEAANWYHLAAADTSDPYVVMPQYNLGNMYATGDGVRRDSAEAARWYRIAAERGHQASQRALGKMYLDGEGVSLNLVEGLAWIMVTANSGSPVSRQLQEEQARRQTPEVVARAEQRSQELTAEVRRNRKGVPSPPDW